MPLVTCLHLYVSMRKSILCGLTVSGLLCLSLSAGAQCKIDAAANCSAPATALLATNLPDAPAPNDGAGTTNAVVEPAAMAIAQRTTPKPQISARENLAWRGLMVASHSAAVFDAWSTRNSLSQGRGYERNPLMRPFASNGSIYAATQVAPTGLDFLSRYMLHRSNPVVRKLWWVPQTAFTAGSIWVGTRNVHVANAK